jgi:hypothetical protein
MTRGVTFETNQITLGRVGQPEDIAKIILSSPATTPSSSPAAMSKGMAGRAPARPDYKGVPQ